MHYDTIFIDWDGTLSLSRFWQHWQESKPKIYEQIQATFADPNITEFDDWMVGKIDSVEFTKWFGKKIQTDPDYLLENLEISAKQMTLAEESSLELVQKLRKSGKKVIIATDNMDTFTNWTVPTLMLDSHFDGIICSYDIGLLKRHGGFFDKYNHDNSVLIDDSSLNHVVKKEGIDYVKIEKGKLVEVLERMV